MGLPDLDNRATVIACPMLLMVGVLKKLRRESLTSNSLWILEIAIIAFSECPPIPKKLASTLMRSGSVLRISDQMPTSCHSNLLAGAT
jgi:hypothetical protein